MTATDTFYSRNHGPVPDIDPDAWRLVVDGLVHTPLELSLADLAARFAERTLSATLQCAGNRRSGLIAVRDIPGEDPLRTRSRLPRLGLAERPVVVPLAGTPSP